MNTDKPETKPEAGRAKIPVQRIVMWLVRTIVVVFAILFAVTWGGIFQGEFELRRGAPAWLVIWAAVNFYRKAT